jgi:N-methylhydantoinase B/oxoprolinase/acetone carboxylase alpha subunit
VEALEPCRLSIVSERRGRSPDGMRGGRPGAPGRNLLNGEELPAKITLDLVAGDVVTIETPGGGGFGESEEENG